MNPRDKRQSYEQIFRGAERFSLSPAEGVRAGVRGTVVLPLTNSTFGTAAEPLTLTLPPSEGERETAGES